MLDATVCNSGKLLNRVSMSLTEDLQLVAEVYGGHDAVQLTRVVPLVPGLHIPQCDLTPIISEIKRFCSL